MPWWLWILVVASCVKIAVALPGYALLTIPRGVNAPFPAWVYAIQTIIFSGFGAVLVLGGRRDRRAQLLGTVFLLAASLFADRPLQQLPAGPPWFIAMASFLLAVQPGAFRSVLMWTFTSSFPRNALTGVWPSVARIGTALSAIVGAFLFCSRFVPWLIGRGSLETAASWHTLLLSSGGPTWRLNTILTLTAIPLVFVNTRAAGVAERRRVRLFVWALVFGTGPILVEAALEAFVPPYGQYMSQASPRFWSGMIFYPMVWVGVAVAGYAVYAAEVLSVRLVIRRAIRYALARATIVTLVAIPFPLMLWFLYAERGRPLIELLTGQRQIVLLALVGTGSILLRVRRGLLDRLDRRFFREQYDARHILGRLIDDARGAPSVTALAATLISEIDRALHVECVHLLIANRTRKAFLHTTGEGGLPLDAALVTLLRGGADPMDVDINTSRHPLQRLPDDEREWIVAGRYRVLVPIKSGEGALIGILALGPKRSELPFSPGDRWLLSAIAASAAVAIENITLRSSTAPGEGGNAAATSASQVAFECQRCFILQSDDSLSNCASCGGRLAPAPVPKTLRGLRLERRIGSGGMGIVYRATDVDLKRAVAVKTLLDISSADAARLRREAQAMAAVAHPNVATIFAVDVWHDRPLLIVEYFESGTLRDRLKSGPLSPESALTLGDDLLAGLQHIHDLGMLHRDIKPSNIGFDASGTAKLFDFGLAKVSQETLKHMRAHQTTKPGGTSALRMVDTTGVLAGTPMYFSPELVALEPPSARSDLWALTLVLFEACAGTNPMNAATIGETLGRISRAAVPDLRTIQPTCPPALATFFVEALSADRESRPQSAAAMRTSFRRLRVSLGYAVES